MCNFSKKETSNFLSFANCFQQTSGRINSMFFQLKYPKSVFPHSGKQTNPSVASHQRQMSLKLSEVFERLKHNEAIEVVLDDVLTNHHVSRFL